jgi:surfeit locus 1 family protein
MKPRLWPVATAALAGIALLCGLGVWQLQRLAWKEELIAVAERRLAAEPVSLTEALKRRAAGEDIEYLRVFARGRYLHDSARLVIATLDDGPAWSVATPFQADDGALILVDRGLVPDRLRDRLAEIAPADEFSAAGILRSHAGGRGFFNPDNDPFANVWYWWDVPAMLSGLPSGNRAVPVVLHLAPDGGSKPYPRPQPFAAGLRNNHLQYALTWFALAAVLAVIAALFVRSRPTNSGA